MPLFQKLAAFSKKVQHMAEEMDLRHEVNEARNAGDMERANELYYDNMREKADQLEKDIKYFKTYAGEKGVVAAAVSKSGKVNLRLRSGSTPIDQFAPELYMAAFPIKFWLGDAMPGMRERPKEVDLPYQAQYLLRRAELQFGKKHQMPWEPYQEVWDSEQQFKEVNNYVAPEIGRWCDNELVATLFDVVRKDQAYKGIGGMVNKPGHFRSMHQVAKITKQMADEASVHCAGAQTINDILRNANVAQPVKESLKSLRLCTRTVPGTESYRNQILGTLEGYRMWFGPSLLFVTINPSETSPILQLLLEGANTDEELKLEIETPALFEFLETRKKCANNPVAMAQYFRLQCELFVKYVLGWRTTHNGARIKSQSGLLGNIAGWYGVIEEQLRGTRLIFHQNFINVL
jgi:hypothetical protein